MKCLVKALAMAKPPSSSMMVCVDTRLFSVKAGAHMTIQQVMEHLQQVHDSPIAKGFGVERASLRAHSFQDGIGSIWRAEALWVFPSVIHHHAQQHHRQKWHQHGRHKQRQGLEEPSSSATF